MFNRWKIGTKISASFALGLSIFAAIGIISFRNTQQLIAASAHERHTHQVLAKLNEVLASLKDAEAGQRSYLLTNEARYMEPYDQAIATLNQRLAQLRQLTADNAKQQTNLDQLEPLVAQKLTELKAAVQLRQTQGAEAALKVVRSDGSGRLMDRARTVAGRMEAEERGLLQARSQSTKQLSDQTLSSILVGVPLGFALLMTIGILLNRHISNPLWRVTQAIQDVSDGDFTDKLKADDRADEIGILTRNFNQMLSSLRQTSQHNIEQTWLKSNLADIVQMLQGQRNLEQVANLLLSKLAMLINAHQGVFYFIDTTEKPLLKRFGIYAHQTDFPETFEFGEGLIGQCAIDKKPILIHSVQSDQLRVHSGLTAAAPISVAIFPILLESEVTAVLELSSLNTFSEVHLALLQEVCANVGVVLKAIVADIQTQALLHETQELAEELQRQQEEIQQSNEELEQVNQDLEHRTHLLEVRKFEVEQKNLELEEARQILEENATQLALSSKYKSEFLANMSHELRTPLNSLLILARILSDNVEGNLTGKQVEYSRAIYSSGSDLLDLINDILDLAKVEAGMMTIEIYSVLFKDLQRDLEQTFRQIATQKRLGFTIALDPTLPSVIATDAKRLQQILKNLLANALKFTERGSVSLSIAPSNDQTIQFTVKDTGIGIASENRELIFEAFQQVDGTTNRKYGGTGLGLSISRELAQRLGGRIELTSAVGQGSTFTLSLPQQQIVPEPIVAPTSVDSDSKKLLIVEDDKIQAQTLMNLMQDSDLSSTAAGTGAAALAALKSQSFDCVIVDLGLPDINGQELVQQIRRDRALVNLPIIVHTCRALTAQEETTLKQFAQTIIVKDARSPERLLRETAQLLHLQNPAEPLPKSDPVLAGKTILIVDDDMRNIFALTSLLEGYQMQILFAEDGRAGLNVLNQHPEINLVLMDMMMPEMDGYEATRAIRAEERWKELPILALTAKAMQRDREQCIEAGASDYITKPVDTEQLLSLLRVWLYR
jgi:signal transduction histidine kinase/DNA-binding response OmpR family regulator/HAMP domain-containing protein